MGYIVMVCSTKRNDSAEEFFSPLSYGRGNEPAHEQLLKRGRATIFDTSKEAWDALENTLKQATIDGAKWPMKSNYAIIEVCSPLL